MTVQISILGLGQTGASLGLALTAAKDQVVRIGNDREPDIARQAQKLGAVDRIVFNLHEAVENSDLVVLALPVDEVRSTLEAIASDLKPGAVVLDAATPAAQGIAWAKELFPPEDRYFLTFTAAVNPDYLMETESGTAAAHADLFKNQPAFIAHAPGVDPSAIDLVENLTRIIGAQPVFADALEVDGLQALASILPELTAAALVNVSVGQPGWREARKLAGQGFARAAEPLAVAPQARLHGQAAVVNRDNTLRLIDALIEELQTLRTAVSSGDPELVHQRVSRARKAREEWRRLRQSGKWDVEEKPAALPNVGERIGRLFGLRPRSEREQNKK